MDHFQPLPFNALANTNTNKYFQNEEFINHSKINQPEYTDKHQAQPLWSTQNPSGVVYRRYNSLQRMNKLQQKTIKAKKQSKHRLRYELKTTVTDNHRDGSIEVQEENEP